MRAGRLNKKVIIQQTTESRGVAGGVDDTWSTYITIWASMEPIAGREYFDAQQLNAEVTTLIRIRYNSGVTSKMRVLHGSRVYDILHVINRHERDAEMHLMCKELI